MEAACPVSWSARPWLRSACGLATAVGAGTLLSTAAHADPRRPAARVSSMPIVRPIAILLTLPMTIVTLGLFLLVINAGMVALVAWMLPGMHRGRLLVGILDRFDREHGEHAWARGSWAQGQDRGRRQARLSMAGLGQTASSLRLRFRERLRSVSVPPGSVRDAHRGDDDHHARELQCSTSARPGTASRERPRSPGFT